MAKKKNEEQEGEEQEGVAEVLSAPSPISIHLAQHPSHELAQVASDSLKELVEKNIKWSQIIYEQNRKIKHRLTWMAVGSYLRLALFIVPLILGIIYLPPLLSDVMQQYQSVFGNISVLGAEQNVLIEALKMLQQ